MQQEIFNQSYLNEQTIVLVVQVLTLIAASVFAYLQYRINRRLKILQDYTALNFIPGGTPTGPQIQVYNVGKQNLYLHKFEVGNTSHTFSKPRLLPIGGNEKSFYGLPVQVTPMPLVNTELNIKLYLTDESSHKYISEGSYIFDTLIMQQQISTNPEGTTPPAQVQVINQISLQLRAWTYKTEKINWKI